MFLNIVRFPLPSIPLLTLLVSGSIFYGAPGLGTETIKSRVPKVQGTATIPQGYEVQEKIVHDITGQAAFFATRAGKHYVFYRDRREGPYDSIRMLNFSRDGGKIAYSATSRGREYCVAEGRRSRPYSTVCNPTFSDDGRLIAFEASDNGRYFVTFGEVASLTKLHETPRFDMSIMRPAFNADGSRLFSALNDYAGSKTLRFISDTGSGRSSSSVYDFIGHFRKSPDGRWYAYMACWNGRYFIVTGTFDLFGQDEREGPAYDLVSEPVISPSGDHVAYAAERSGRQFIVVGARFAMEGSREGAAFDRVWQPSFVDDGRQVCYNAAVGSEVARRCIESPSMN